MMKVVVKHFADPDETITAIPGKVTAHIEMEDGSGESTEAIDLTLGQQLTYTVSGGAGSESYLDDTEVQAVLDPAPPAEGAMTERGAAVAEKVRTMMAETPQPWTSADLDEAIRHALGGYVEGVESALCGNPACRHSKARHTGARSVEGRSDERAGLATACDEVGCPCGAFRPGPHLSVNPTYRKALATADPPAEEEYALMGVPISEVSHVTLDGRHWLEVFGTIYVSGLDQPDAFDGPALIFRVAQAPGGKAAKFGLEQGATVVVAPHRVLAVVRKAG